MVYLIFIFALLLSLLTFWQHVKLVRFIKDERERRKEFNTTYRKLFDLVSKQVDADSEIIIYLLSELDELQTGLKNTNSKTR